MESVDRAELLSSVQRYKTSYERDVLHILNLAPGMPAVHPETPVAEARRNYMKIAALIHPDKFTSTPSLQATATEAFQVLVKGFEFFASPNFRKAAEAAKVKPKAAEPKPTPKPKKEAKKKEDKPKTVRPKKSTKKVLLDDEESEDDDDDDDDDESNDDESDGGDNSDDDTMTAIWSETLAPPPRSVKEVLTRNRTNDGCLRTTVKCPRCASAWQPDDNKQYSLFMGYGLKIHCQLCLLLYGCATATHVCSCSKPFDYDSSLYDSKVSCTGKCKKTFGFMYYPVTGEHLNKIREADAEEEAKRRNAEEREARARARGGGEPKPASAAGGTKMSEDELLTLVGKCAVDEECPICNKRVASKHRSHVEACLLNPPPPKKKRVVRKFIENDDDSSDGERKTRSRKTPAKKPAPKKASLASKKPAAKRAPRKRSRHDSDDSD